jgi:hypothetical protein
MVLSTRANKWWQKFQARRIRWPHPRAILERALGDRAWESLILLERDYGGISGSDGRELYIGADGAPGGNLVRPLKMIFDRPHVCIGYYAPIAWYLDESGAITEVDDQGRSFYRSDSLGKRLEQLALDVTAAGDSRERIQGFLGAQLASQLGLVPLPEPSDSRQRYWATPDFAVRQRDAILVRESREPIDRGRAELADCTWVEAGNHRREKQLRHALSAVRQTGFGF